MLITKSELLNYDKRYRTQLVNSLSGFKSANLIGTTNGNQQTNLAVVSSVIHLGAQPPLVGFIMRPSTVERHTFENIKEIGHYTINQVSSDLWLAAHQTSARYERAISEFDEVGLTPEYIDSSKAPFVAESLIKYAVELKEIIHLSVNNTDMIIGEIQDVIVAESFVQQDGYIDIEKAQTVTISGLDSYHQTSRLARVSYAKANKNIQQVDLDGK